MKKENIKKPIETKKQIKKVIVNKIPEQNLEKSQIVDEISNETNLSGETVQFFQNANGRVCSDGVMSIYPEHSLAENWNREGFEISQTIEEKLDKIIKFLNSIESELIEFNTSKNLTVLSNEVKDDFSLYEMSWNTLDYLHKQSADTLNRLNFHPQNLGEEFNFAKKRFDKLNDVLINKLNQINWD